MDGSAPAPERALLNDQLEKATAARLGVPASLEQYVRDYAHAARIAGMQVQRMIVDVKEAVRTITGDQDIVFLPRVVGWAVAGYFAGATPEDLD